MTINGAHDGCGLGTFQILQSLHFKSALQEISLKCSFFLEALPILILSTEVIVLNCNCLYFLSMNWKFLEAVFIFLEMDSLAWQVFKEQANSTRSRGVRKEARNNWPTFHPAAVVKLWPKATWGRVYLMVEFISELMNKVRPKEISFSGLVHACGVSRFITVVVWGGEMQTRPVDNLWLWKAYQRLGPCLTVFSVWSPLKMSCLQWDAIAREPLSPFSLHKGHSLFAGQAFLHNPVL